MSLEEYRAELDQIDKTLEEYFVKRMKVVKKIGEYKKAKGLPTYDGGREKQVIEKHTAAIEEELKPYMARYFEEMMAISRSYQDADRK